MRLLARLLRKGPPTPDLVGQTTPAIHFGIKSSRTRLGTQNLASRATARYGLTQEYITPYTPQQNGLCERFIKTFKEELCWTRRFQSIEHARLAVRAWIDHYNTRRPHQSLNYLTPTQYHERLCKQAA